VDAANVGESKLAGAGRRRTASANLRQPIGSATPNGSHGSGRRSGKRRGSPTPPAYVAVGVVGYYLCAINPHIFGVWEFGRHTWLNLALVFFIGARERAPSGVSNLAVRFELRGASFG
jgi:hypothetical protein